MMQDYDCLNVRQRAEYEDAPNHIWRDSAPRITHNASAKVWAEESFGDAAGIKTGDCM